MNVEIMSPSQVDHFALYQRPSDGQFVFEKVLKTPSKAEKARDNLGTQEPMVCPVSYSTLDHQAYFLEGLKNNRPSQLIGRVFFSPFIALFEGVLLIGLVVRTVFKELPMALYKRDSLCLRLSVYRIRRQCQTILADLISPFNYKLSQRIHAEVIFHNELYKVVENASKIYKSDQSHLVTIQKGVIPYETHIYPTINTKALGYTFRNLREIVVYDLAGEINKQASINAQMHVISTLGFKKLIEEKFWGRDFLERLATVDEGYENLDTPLHQLTNPLLEHFLKAELTTSEEFGRLTLRECGDKFNPNIAYDSLLAEDFRPQPPFPGFPFMTDSEENTLLNQPMSKFGCVSVHVLNLNLEKIPAFCMRYCTDLQIEVIDHSRLSEIQLFNMFSFKNGEQERRLALLKPEQQSRIRVRMKWN